MALVAAGLVLLALNWNTTNPGGATGARTDAMLFLAFVSFPTMGAIIVAHQPQNRIGWVFCAAGVAMAVLAFTKQYSLYAGLTNPSSLPAAKWVAWIAEWAWILALIPPITLIFLLFPDGKLLSPRWRIAVWGIAIGTVLLVAGFAFRPGPLDDSPFFVNPAGIPSLREPLEIGEFAGFLIGFISIVVAVASLIVRMRQRRGIERQQIKWITFAGAALALTIVGLNLVSTTFGIAWLAKFADDSADLAVATIPVAVAIAVLRHRLYDIDRIINRTLTYGLLTAGLALIYFGLVVSLQTALRSVSGGGDLAIVVTTLVVAALFLPARRRVQDAVDRRFNRRAYDAARTVTRSVCGCGSRSTWTRCEVNC
jgi:hypothetical protein